MTHYTNSAARINGLAQEAYATTLAQAHSKLEALATAGDDNAMAILAVLATDVDYSDAEHNGHEVQLDTDDSQLEAQEFTHAAYNVTRLARWQGEHWTDTPAAELDAVDHSRGPFYPSSEHTPYQPHTVEHYAPAQLASFERVVVSPLEPHAGHGMRHWSQQLIGDSLASAERLAAQSVKRSNMPYLFDDRGRERNFEGRAWRSNMAKAREAIRELGNGEA